MIPFTELVYGLTGVGLFALGVLGALLHRALLGRVLAINVCGAGVFLVFVTLAYRGPSMTPDPVPHALVLTGIVVAISATALAIALGRRLRDRPPGYKPEMNAEDRSVSTRPREGGATFERSGPSSDDE